MTYFESARGQKITQRRALYEVNEHGADPDEFLRDNGDRAMYDAQTVLEWLGY